MIASIQELTAAAVAPKAAEPVAAPTAGAAPAEMVAATGAAGAWQGSSDTSGTSD